MYQYCNNGVISLQSPDSIFAQSNTKTNRTPYQLKLIEITSIENRKKQYNDRRKSPKDHESLQLAEIHSICNPHNTILFFNSKLKDLYAFSLSHLRMRHSAYGGSLMQKTDDIHPPQTGVSVHFTFSLPQMAMQNTKQIVWECSVFQQSIHEKSASPLNTACRKARGECGCLGPPRYHRRRDSYWVYP